MISAEFIAMLLCPENRLPLALANAEIVERINAAVRANRLRNRGGQLVTEPLDGGLLRQDGRVLYPVISDIPRMLLDDGIPLDQLRGEG